MKTQPLSKKCVVIAMMVVLGILTRSITSHADEPATVPVVSGPEVWKDSTQTPEARAADLVRA